MTSEGARTDIPPLSFRQLTPETWDDLEELFGPVRGASGGCWCMWFRMRRPEWEKAGRQGRKAAFRERVARGEPTGILAYSNETAVEWCAVAPREATPNLERSRVAKPLDDESAWAVTCFYVRSGWRDRGLMQALLQAAVKFAGEHGATMIEGYPRIPKGRHGWGDLSVGVPSAFEACGFVQVARRSPVRPFMRKRLDGNS